MTKSPESSCIFVSADFSDESGGPCLGSLGVEITDDWEIRPPASVITQFFQHQLDRCRWQFSMRMRTRTIQSLTSAIERAQRKGEAVLLRDWRRAPNLFVQQSPSKRLGHAYLVEALLAASPRLGLMLDAGTAYLTIEIDLNLEAWTRISVKWQHPTETVFTPAFSFAAPREQHPVPSPA